MGHHLGSPIGDPVAAVPPAKVKYQRTTKGRKAQKVNLMLAAAAEDLSPVPGATSPLMMQRGGGGPGFGPTASQMGGSYGQMAAGGPFMEGGVAGGGGSFQHPFYGHMHEGSPNGYYGEGGQPSQQQQQHQQQMMGMRGLPSFEQDFLRGPQHQQPQQQRPFYTTAGMGGMKQHSMDHLSTIHEPDYDALHRHHVSPSTTVTGGSVGAPGVVGAMKGDANNNNCDYSEMRMFNGGGSGGGIKSEFTVGEDHQSSGGRLSSPMTNTNATTPDDVLEEL